MNLIVTHIYMEGNFCADKLGNMGLTTNSLKWMKDIPIQVRADFTWNKLGLPYFRFVNL